jgi:cyclic pyranopterin phosphate synthase
MPQAAIALRAPAAAALMDQRSRPLRDLRISVIDRCNFRCGYCMPRQVFDADYPFMHPAEYLSFDNITRIARVFADLGVQKLRLTGGEPLLRKHLDQLVARLAALRQPNGQPLALTLTTNGVLLARLARRLADAGLSRVSVSLDALAPDTFARMTDTAFTPDQVLHGIDVAADAGLGPVHINMVVRAGMNDDQIVPMARRFRNSGHVLRFIEYMDVGATNAWRLSEVISSVDVLARLQAEFALEPLDEPTMGRVARRWRYLDGAGEIGVISSVTDAFCGGCTRLRLSPDGCLYTCLFATQGHDLQPALRAAKGDADLADVITRLWQSRSDNYSERRANGFPLIAKPRVEMSFIGG